MKGKIVSCDHTGDSVLAEYDTDNATSVKVAQDALTKFLNDCVLKYGDKPPVWSKRAGATAFKPVELKNLDLSKVEEVMLHRPLRGG